MRILVFTQYFWPEQFTINYLVLLLKKAGHDVEVLTGKPNYPKGEFFTGYKFFPATKESWNDITINRVPLVARGKESRLGLFINYISFILFAAFIAPWMLRRKEYDTIFVYAPSPVLQALPAILLGKLKKVPVILWVQDLWPESLSATEHVKSSLILSAVRYLVKFCYSHVDLILVQSKAFIEPVKKLAIGKRVEYFPNTVDSNFYNLKNKKSPLIHSLNTGFSILFAGNIGNAQSMETIVEASLILQKYSDIKIVVVGSGSKLDWVFEQKKLRNLNNLHLEGHFPVDVMPSIMRSASVLLVSLKDNPILDLTVPNKIQAYLATGKPIIASLNGEGARIVVESGAGLAIPAEDAQALANAILKLYKMSENELAAMADNGRKYFKKNFDEHVLITKLVELLKL